MLINVNGTRLWFDVEGPAVVPDGVVMRQRPTVLLVHGGPGSDHSYFKPDFARLAEHTQVVYLDLRGHGRSARSEPSGWSYESCADDIRTFCDELGITRPTVLGHSLGAPIVLLYGARHPAHAAGLIIQSGFARWDGARVVEAIRRAGGDQVAEIAGRNYGGYRTTKEEDRLMFAAFGPSVPSVAQLARRCQNHDLIPYVRKRTGELDIADQLGAVVSPTLVSVGELDPVTPVSAAEEIIRALPEGIAQLEVVAEAGHFPWLDAPDRYWPAIIEFVQRTK